MTEPARARHVAIIMDGNGRWAKRHHLPRVVGHQRGVEAGVFRPDVDPVDLHMSISALCFFNVANRHTFGAIFKRSLDTPAATAQRRESIIEMIVRFLRP